MKKYIRIISIVAAAILCVVSLASCAEDEGFNLPIVCGETGMNEVCGVATYGVDYYSLGVKAGDMAAEILLNGAKASEMAVETDPNPALSVNTKVAEEIGFKIPDAIAAKASTGDGAQVERVASAIVTENEDFTVGILQLVQHVALDKANDGFQDELSVKMAAAGKTVKILNKNASNDQSNNTTIAASFVEQNVDLIYSIATSSSQAAVSAAAEKNIPVIFNAVTDPVDAGLVESLDKPGKNVTGVSDMNPVAKQIDLIGELLGEKDVNIGLLYTSSETNSVLQIELAETECKAKGYKFVKKGISDINDIQAAFTSLKQSGVTAIYVPTDNTLANGTANIHALNTGK